MNDRKSVNSFMVIFFLFMPSITLPLKLVMESGVIVWIITPVLVLISLFYNRNFINKKFIYMSSIINVLFLINILIVPYKDITIYLYIEFIKFSLLALFFSTQKLNYKKMYKYWYIIGYLNIVIWLFNLDGVIEGSTSYMFFGVTMTMSFSIIFYNFLLINKKLDLLTSVFVLMLIFIFGNRSALLACIGLFIVLIALKYRNPLHYIYIISIGVLFYLIDIKKYIISTILYINDILIANNIESYSLWQFTRLLNKGLAGASSGRDSLYEQSLEIIQSSYFPKGIGYYQYITTGNYPHNLFLDFFIIFGFLGIVLLPLFILCIYNFYKIESNIIKKNMVTILLVINSIRLFFSSTFIFDADFWVIVGLISTTLLNTKSSQYNLNKRKRLIKQYN